MSTTNTRVDYLTVTCGCHDQPCWLCTASENTDEDCGDDYCDGTCRN